MIRLIDDRKASFFQYDEDHHFENYILFQINDMFIFRKYEKYQPSIRFKINKIIGPLDGAELVKAINESFN
jgi:hypothetical protein